MSAWGTFYEKVFAFQVRFAENDESDVIGWVLRNIAEPVLEVLTHSN
jgi:hypothetical protein